MEREGAKAPLILPLLFLFYSDLSPPPSAPLPFVFSTWFYFLMPSSVLSLFLSGLFPPLLDLLLFLGRCTTHLVYTVYTQPAKRNPTATLYQQAGVLCLRRWASWGTGSTGWRLPGCPGDCGCRIPCEVTGYIRASDLSSKPCHLHRPH